MLNNFLVNMNGEGEKLIKLLDVLNKRSSIRWASGHKLNSEACLAQVLIEINGYLIIQGNTLYWGSKEEVEESMEEFEDFNKFNSIDEFIEEIVNKMEKKLEVKDIAIIASDDDFGEKLLAFLNEFTEVKFNSGHSLDDEQVREAMEFRVENEPKDTKFIFLIKDNKLFFDVYCPDEDYSMYVPKIYDSVRDFLLCKDEWISE